MNKRIMVLLLCLISGFALGMEDFSLLSCQPLSSTQEISVTATIEPKSSVELKPLSKSKFSISLPTSKENRTTTLMVGEGLKTPDRIVELVNNPEVKKIYGSIDFGGHQFFKVVGSMTKRLKLEDEDQNKLDTAELNINKRMLAIPSQRAMIDKFVAAGGKVHIVPVHDKTFAFKRKDSSVIEAILTSSNLSERASKKNYEVTVDTNDSPLKAKLAANIQESFEYGTPYLGDGAIPTVSPELAAKQEQAFKPSGVFPAFKEDEQYVVMSSLKHDIPAFRKAEIQKVIDSDEQEKWGYVGTMTLGPDMAAFLSEVNFPFTLVLDKSGVNATNRPLLAKLAAKDNVTILVCNRPDAIDHEKFLALQHGDHEIQEISTQNYADFSGTEFNQSVVTRGRISPVKEYANGLSSNPSFVPVSPKFSRYDAAVKKRVSKRKKKKEEIASGAIAPVVVSLSPTKQAQIMATKINKRAATTANMSQQDTRPTKKARSLGRALSFSTADTE